MDQLRGILESFYSSYKKLPKDSDGRVVLLNTCCETIKEQYIILPPTNDKNKEFIKSINKVNIEYKKNRLEETKNKSLSEIILSTIYHRDPSTSTIEILRDNYAIIERKNLDEYIDSIKLMNQLTGERNNPPFSRIKIYGAKRPTQRQIYLASFKFLDNEFKNYSIETTFISIKDGITRISIQRKIEINNMIDGLELINDIKNLTREIKESQKEQINKIPIFKDHYQSSIKIERIYVTSDDIEKLSRKRLLTSKRTFQGGVRSSYLGDKYELFNKRKNYDMIVSLTVKIPLNDFFNSICDIAKKTL